MTRLPNESPSRFICKSQTKSTDATAAASVSTIIRTGGSAIITGILTVTSIVIFAITCTACSGAGDSSDTAPRATTGGIPKGAPRAVGPGAADLKLTPGPGISVGGTSEEPLPTDPPPNTSPDGTQL